MAATSANQKPLPPGSLGLPFIGEPPRLLDTYYLMAQYAKYGPVYKTRVLGRNVAVFMGPEANRFLLQTGMHHFIWRDGWPPTFKELLGESLFVQDGDEHRIKRRLIMPAFHRQALHHYLGTMDEIARRYVAKWAQMGQFGWLQQNKQYTFEVASTLLTGSQPGDDIERLSHLFVTLTRGFVTLPLRWSWTPYGRALAARQELLKYIDRAIENRRQNPTHDALSLLVQTRDEEGNALSNEELQAQTLLLLFAGHETSASMLTSLAMALAQSPHVWEKARAEQEALHIGDALTMEHLRQMPYLDQVLKEVERMYPPVPAGFRAVTETFEFNGYTIPKGWTALYPINAAHRDPAVYTEPDAFDPDRFSPERNENSAPFSLVGFGGGPRVCVGFAFAQLEMKVLLSHLLRGYTWELLPRQNLSTYYRPTLMPKDGMQVIFHKR
ncbi:cytochrome P450 [Phototrophicus methaneseepsis]|uniref:Cytochrome P450 n=1 Tax=Phototrophicus methaneseepsis TaxID=2710758 RepID=A0A7S8IDX4_9CHLR|nr:cytochrome P450 [Phototrophicus methaneseepsis]QPC81991.1 cytochrome P450 [Phototrophicus methaneseepsis]